MPILSLTSTFIVSHQLLFAFNVTKPILFGGYRCGACPPNRPKGTINYQLTSILYDFGGISSQIQALLSYKYPSFHWAKGTKSQNIVTLPFSFLILTLVR